VNRAIFRVPPESSGGGAERHGYNLANYLAKLGHEVYFISKTRHGAEYHPLVKVHNVPPRRSVIPAKTGFFGWTLKHLSGNLLSFVTALRVLPKERFAFDVIHCHGALTAFLLSVSIGRKIPVVYTMHDASPWIAWYPNFLERSFRKLAYICTEVPCLRHVKRVVTVSPILSFEAIRWRSLKKRVIYVPNGIEVAQTSQSRLVNGKSEPLGIFVGQLVPRKGVSVLLQAISKLSDGKTQFVIIGDGPEKDALVRQSEDLRIRNRVFFVGYVGDKELENYFSRASFFVFPSFSESFGIALFNAIARGLPAVASNLLTYHGILRNGENALLFDPGNVDQLVKCLENITTNDTLRRRLSENGSSFVKKHFDWEDVARRIASIYFDISPKRN